MKLLQPLQDYIFVQIDEGPVKSAGGIFAPETAKDKLRMATVLRVGPGCWKDGVFIPVDLKPGDRVLIGASDEVRLEDLSRCALVKYSNNVIGVMRESYSFEEEDDGA